ncbi:uncharacterized protein NECHADRAFT_75203 [Fusarium vanettenii 77-13-4]|uniref:Uncharacterized protein n=1 Tax=Fusarium vanettenii (strain ATCC MYA-4622 / CBS 123669 / FGSC 9596 / NRRL 45880 / 77-13-4) TaxID=660122 RepID=C7YI57_FUSV7|nr:uncharacterized protein NECHADRAFT_75203 [Fusarium vanettenii 77-13-4]EEU48039.1 predicted protein [Fusarium vanettenii 77-13-4]
MSTTEKRKFTSREDMQKHVNGLVASGAIVVGPRKRLRIGDDGLLQVIDPARSPMLMPYSDARKRLINVINYLESPAGPKSVDWCNALNKLQLLDSKDERDGQLDIRAWKICAAAHKEAIDDLTYMDLLKNAFPDKHGYDDWEFTDNNHTVIEFAQRACRLLGISSSGEYREEAWDDGLAEEMLEKDLEAYRLVDRFFKLLVEFDKSDWAFCEYPYGSKVRKYMKSFRELQPIKALDAVMENEHFLILERKAKTAKRAQASQAALVPRKQPREQEQNDASD